MKLLLELGMVVAILVCACWIAHAQDAALVAQTFGEEGRTVEAASWELAQPTWLQQRRVWGDLFDAEAILRMDFPDAGAGLSIDALPGQPYCIGAGYHRGWVGYAGAHVRW